MTTPPDMMSRGHCRTIWVVDAKHGPTRGLHTPAGPHLLLRDEPQVGDVIVARILVRPTKWAMNTDGNKYTAEYKAAMLGPQNEPLRLWSRPAHARQLGDDSDAPESRDFSAEVLREVLCGIGEWESASCEVRVNDDADPVLVIEGWTP